MAVIDPIHLADEDDPRRPRLVSSSAISYVSYDPDLQILFVTLMADGVTRPYGNVPYHSDESYGSNRIAPGTYVGLLAAESKGRYYNYRIKPFYSLLVG